MGHYATLDTLRQDIVDSGVIHLLLTLIPSTHFKLAMRGKAMYILYLLAKSEGYREKLRESDGINSLFKVNQDTNETEKFLKTAETILMYPHEKNEHS